MEKQRTPDYFFAHYLEGMRVTIQERMALGFTTINEYHENAGRLFCISWAICRAYEGCFDHGDPAEPDLAYRRLYRRWRVYADEFEICGGGFPEGGEGCPIEEVLECAGEAMKEYLDAARYRYIEERVEEERLARKAAER